MLIAKGIFGNEKMSETVDIYRDTWVRYLGYCNEVGESFRPLVPRVVVRWSYIISFGYGFADTVDKSWKMYKKDGSTRKVMIEFGDALIWQTLASVVVPGYTINRLCFHTVRLLKEKYPKTAVKSLNLVAVAVCLMSIPIIVHPIDNGVTAVMDRTYRKVLS